MTISRTPPKRVRKQLRKEVGFGCPIDGCGIPFLEYHHFDPPWAERKHHEPKGMIALCPTHHRQADAFTKDRLCQLKETARMRRDETRGRLEWLEHDLLAVVGMDLYYEVREPLSIDNKRVIWFNRDAERHLLLNVRMPSPQGEPRLIVADNDFVQHGEPEDLECPPGGRELSVKYCGGDWLRLYFRDLHSVNDARRLYPETRLREEEVHFPIVAVEVRLRVSKWGIMATFLAHSGFTAASHRPPLGKGMLAVRAFKLIGRHYRSQRGGGVSRLETLKERQTNWILMSTVRACHSALVLLWVDST